MISFKLSPLNLSVPVTSFQ